MTRDRSNHLSEAALNDVLIGMASPESELHLAVCEACRGRVEGFHSHLTAFNEATLAWSDARPIAAARVAARPQMHRLPLAVAGWAMAVVLLALAALPVWRRIDHVSMGHNTTVALPSEDSQAQIAQDNKLLQAVNAAINPNEASLLHEYGISNGSHPGLKERPE